MLFSHLEHCATTSLINMLQNVSNQENFNIDKNSFPSVIEIFDFLINPYVISTSSCNIFFLSDDEKFCKTIMETA